MEPGQYSGRFLDLVHGIKIIKLGKTIGTFLNLLVGALTEKNCCVHGFYKFRGVLKHETRLAHVPVQSL
jgi:hypothetical protein